LNTEVKEGKICGGSLFSVLDRYHPDHGNVGDVSTVTADYFYPVHVWFVYAVDMEVVPAFIAFWSHFIFLPLMTLLWSPVFNPF